MILNSIKFIWNDFTSCLTTPSKSDLSFFYHILINTKIALFAKKQTPEISKRHRQTVPGGWDKSQEARKNPCQVDSFQSSGHHPPQSTVPFVFLCFPNVSPMSKVWVS